MRLNYPHIGLLEHYWPKIGKDCRIDPDVLIDSCRQVIIGNRCFISQPCYIMGHQHERPNHDAKAGKSLIIGSNVWIYPDVLILPSVRKIGNNVTIASKSVITHDIPDGETWAGNPARCIHDKKA